jgi:hypothetical protein
MSQSVSQFDAMDHLLTNFAAELHTAFPGQIVSYNASSQTATIRPMIKRPLLTMDVNDGEDEWEDLPDIPAVPIMHPRGGKSYIHLPVAEGDSVLVVVSQMDYSTWRTTGTANPPSIPVLHDLSSCFAIPGAFHNGQVVNPSDGTSIIIKNDNFEVKITDQDVQVDGQSDAAALASIVDDQLNSLKTAINGWTPASNDGGAALKVALTDWLTDVCNAASSKLKVGG